MNSLKAAVIVVISQMLACSLVLAAQTPGKKLTCCQEASAKDKECSHKCCVAAHKRGESCVKCNPGKEDLALKKKDSKGGKKTSASR